MCQYYKDRLSASVSQTNKNPTKCTTQAPVLSEFDKLHESLLTDDAAEGWASELRRYLGRMEQDVMKETNFIEWWQVRNSLTLIFFNIPLQQYLTHRTMHSYFLPLLISPLTYSLHRLHQFLVKDCSQEANRLQWTAGHPYVLKLSKNW